MTLHGTVRPLVENDSVRFVFEVTNNGESTEELVFRDTGAAEFVAERVGSDGNRSGARNSDDERASRENESGGEECWRWSENRMFAQVIETERLDPGESSTYEGKWHAPDTGCFVVRATLRARDHAVEAAGEFSIDG